MKSLNFLLFLIILLSCRSDKVELSNSTAKVSLDSEVYNVKDLIGNDFLIDNLHSYLGFRIKYFGFSPVRGRFDEFNATLFYDGSNIRSLSCTVFIDVYSINTGNERRDNDLKREGSWFDASTYPVIGFKSTEIMPKQDGTFDVIGELTIKEITHTDTITFNQPTRLTKDWAGNDQIDFSGSVIINRQDYEVYGGDFWSSVMENGLTQLSDEVEIEIDLHCRKADYQIRYETADSLDIIKQVLDSIKLKGIDEGMQTIVNLHKNEKLTAGKLSSIGYTLNAWGLHEQALTVFNKRLELYPDLISTWNQLGITNLHLNNIPEAQKYFKLTQEQKSDDARSLEYLRLLQRMYDEQNIE